MRYLAHSLGCLLLVACTGDAGTNGADGHGSLVNVAAEAAGANCASGGQRIDIGVDDNGDGALGADEIDTTTYVCNGGGGDAGTDTLVTVTAEPAGANCEAGGQRIDAGVDDNANGILDASEIDSTSYVCDGAQGTEGTSQVVDVTPEAAGANCASGGQQIDVGIDDDRDGTLDAAEVDSTTYVCNGDLGGEGANALVSLSAEPAGANCAAGGQQIDVGTDDDRDGTLDAAEIDSTSYVCAASNGFTSLLDIKAEPVGANCSNGGQRIDVGIDDDRDGTLDANEIDETAYVCHGTCKGQLDLAYTGAIETAVIPACAGAVRIEAWGAQGGGGMQSVVGGQGAYIAGTFNGLAGKTLRVLVGGRGLAGTDTGEQAGGTGGGGSFVVDGSTPLVIAGGGGGAMGRSGLPVNGGPGQTTTSGQAGQYAGGAGGTNGGGGGTWPWPGWHSGTGGGGFTGNGSAPSNGNSVYGTPNGPGIAFANGGAGGTAGSLGRKGGFGGGGAAGFTGGGGGGYSGGGSGTHDTPQSYNGGGGGSFNGGTSPSAQSGANAGDGRVLLTWQ